MPNGLRETSTARRSFKFAATSAMARMIMIRLSAPISVDQHARRPVVCQLVLKDRQRFWVGVGAYGDGRHVVVGHVKPAPSIPPGCGVAQLTALTGLSSVVRPLMTLVETVRPFNAGRQTLTPKRSGSATLTKPIKTRREGVLETQTVPVSRNGCGHFALRSRSRRSRRDRQSWHYVAAHRQCRRRGSGVQGGGRARSLRSSTTRIPSSVICP